VKWNILLKFSTKLLRKMNDIVLVNPNYTKSRDKRFCFHLPIQCYPPLGLAYLASSLEKSNIPVKIIDARALNISEKETVEMLCDFFPKVIGIYVTSFNLPHIYNLIKKIKDAMNSTVIVGGPHVTHYPQSVLTLNADYGMVGDGERSLVKFMKKYERRNVQKVEGLIYFKNKKMFVNPPKIIKNLDTLPFPSRHLLPNKKYYSPLHKGMTTTMVTSRGCPFDCIFCGSPNKKSYRKRSPKNVIKEIELIANEGFEYIEIEDDCFTLDRERVKKICELIIRKKIKIDWGCETRIDCVDEKLLSLMRRAGCINVRYGIESGNEKIRSDIIGKKISNEEIRKVIKNMKEEGLISVAYFMFGHPTETFKQMKETIEFALEIDPDYADFHLAIPIPGSRLFRIAIEEGKIEKNVWDKVTRGAPIPVYVPNNVALSEMIEIQRIAYKTFYGRVSCVIKNAMRMKNIEDLISKARTSLILAKNQFIRFR
jgi:radical SAM superfamily enzyme YgiQ (UPF0313 family)